MTELSEDCILLELKAAGKEEVLCELAAVVAKKHPAIQADSAARMLLEREQIGSTGVGEGVAIPHAKLPELDKMVLCFGRSGRGVPFDAKDRLPVRLFVMILAPTHMAAEYLQTLGRISKILKNEAVRSQLLLAADAAAVQRLFAF
jgi:PTS system nitrogen regulatory IIA component